MKNILVIILLLVTACTGPGEDGLNSEQRRATLITSDMFMMVGSRCYIQVNEHYTFVPDKVASMHVNTAWDITTLSWGRGRITIRNTINEYIKLVDQNCK